MRLADLLQDQGDTGAALTYFDKAIALQREMQRVDPLNAEIPVGIGLIYEGIGYTKLKMNDLKGAVESFGKALSMAESDVAHEPNNRIKRIVMFGSYEGVGQTLLKMGDPARALENFRKAQEILEQLLLQDPTDPESRYYVANLYFYLGQAYVALAEQKKISAAESKLHWREARDWYQKSLDIYQDLNSRNQLPKKTLHEMDDVKRGLEKCDAALAKLKG
jgi:tetratricopeptide (TPR) repeat protein